MNRILNVHLLPELANPSDLAGHCSVIIDVLRASTTITTALTSSADRVIPCLTIEEAQERTAQRPGALLGGERGGQRPPGFDLGNSPAEYCSDRVGGRTIVFTTTNGTKAMARCSQAARVLVGALVNRAALCQALCKEARIDLLCAGTGGAISMDDVLTAGAIVDRLSGHAAEWQLNDSAHLSRSLWLHEVGPQPSPERIVASLARSIGGRNLIALDMRGDIRIAADLDTLDRVGVLDLAEWQIR